MDITELLRLTPEQIKALKPEDVAETLGKVDGLIKAVKRSVAGKSMPSFMADVLEISTPPHIMEWIKLLQTEQRLVVEASRDHAKSWTFSYAWPLFNIQKTKNPKEAENIALVSYSEEQARKNLARTRKAVENTPCLKWLMPKSKSYSWEASLLNFSNEATLEAFGFGSSIRGGHYHKVIIDDPTKDHWSMSLAEQENFLYGVIIPAVRRGGQLIVCGNPVDMKDLLERLEQNKEFKTFKYPCWNDKMEPLWAEQYTIEDLRARQRQIPAHIFAREYLLKRVSALDAKFKQEWIHYYTEDRIEGRKLYRIMTIDPAISPGGDALGVSVTGTDIDGNTFILDRLSFRGDFKTGVEYLCDIMERNNPDFIGIETFAFQRMYKVWLEEAMKRRGLEHFHVEEVGRDSRKIKSVRIESLQPKLAQGRLFFKEEHEPLINQLLAYDPLSKTNDDDEIDALAYQVPLWQSPFGEDAKPREVKAGSFEAAFEEIKSRNSGGFMGKLFTDYMH